MTYKPALPNLSSDYDPLEAVRSAPAPAPQPTPQPAQTQALALPPGKRRAKAKGAQMRQRGLHLTDETILSLRIAALKRGTTASRLADEILRKAIAS